MHKLSLFLLLVWPLVHTPGPDVKVSGAMKNIMQKNDFSAHVKLDTLDKKGLFGLGPAAGLKGEILVINGTVYTSSKDGDQLINKQDQPTEAAMLVYSQVTDWISITIDEPVNSYDELEKKLDAIATEKGFDNTPFTFKIETTHSHAAYHVIDWKAGTAHTMDNHKQFAYSGVLNNSPSILVGFYSRRHQGIFTHHSSHMHIHILEESTRIVGHLDDITLQAPWVVRIAEK